MEIAVSHEQGRVPVTILHAQGKIDVNSYEQLQAQARAAVEAGTRDVLLDCAKSIDIIVEERAMKLEDARRADEVFITSSTRELVWVRQWDGLEIGNSKLGPLTKRLHEEYRRRVTAVTG